MKKRTQETKKLSEKLENAYNINKKTKKQKNTKIKKNREVKK